MAIESFALSSEILGDASGLENGKPFRSLEDGELPNERFGQKRVHRGCFCIFFVSLLFFLSSGTLIGTFNLRVDINLVVFYVEELGSDANQT